MAFLRNLLAAILGSLVAFGIVFFMFLLFLSLAGSTEQVHIDRHSVLDLNFPYPISEYSGYDPEDPFSVLFDPTMGLNEITKAIALAREDDRIEGISLTGPYLLAGISQTRAIRQALADFKSSGKFVYAYGDFYMQKDYYLASVADSIFLNPAGNFDFKGLAAEVLYFGDFQDKSGIRMEVVRHGKYKSAVEPFLANEMSEDNRRQLTGLLGSIWEGMRDEIAESRGVPADSLDRIADGLTARNPAGALAGGLVDGVVYQDQYEEKLLRESGASGDSPKRVSLSEYLKYTKNKRQYEGADRIAVIYAQGEILYGQGGSNYIDPNTMRKALRKARKDRKVKAVVLRINSPGGSALSSELIWREINQLRQDKPVVVSFSDLAASGGYYMAVGADKIITEPTTLTGSIGVFATIPNLSGLAGKVGINSEQVGTHRQSVDYSLFEPMSDEFREVLREGIETTYRTFLERVAEGRGITVAQADSLAQGRVWSGADAVKLGLADALGGMPEALEAAAGLAGISDYRIVPLPKYKTGLERLLDDLGGTDSEARETLLEEELGPDWAEVLRALKAQLRQEGVQARLPFTIKIH